MAEVEGKPVSLEELTVSTLAMTDALAQAADREERHYGCGVQAEAAGGACGVSAHFEFDNTVTTKGTVMSHLVKAHAVRARV